MDGLSARSVTMAPGGKHAPARPFAAALAAAAVVTAAAALAAALVVAARVGPARWGGGLAKAARTVRGEAAAAKTLHGMPLTTVRCTDGERGERAVEVARACEYRNLYLRDGVWTAVMDRARYDAEALAAWQGSKFSSGWRPELAEAGEELAAVIAAAGGAAERRGVHLYFGQPWTHNIGHGLWDGLYAVWVAAVRLGHGRTTGRLEFIVDQYDVAEVATDEERQTFDWVVRAFSGTGDYIRNRDLVKLKGWSRYEAVVYGSGAKGQRWMNKDLRLPGFEDGAVRLFRERMYAMHNVSARPWVAGRSRRAVRAIVVDNKRYTARDREEIDKVVALAGAHGYNLTYVDWGAVGTRPNNFAAHLQLLGDTDVYISGPGTGQMYLPFLPDKAVFVGLGALNEQFDGMRWVHYMEEYMCEGTPHVRALYYPSRLRAGGIRAQVLAGLFDTAVDITVDGFESPPPPGSNLSLEGQIFVRTCARAPEACRFVLDGMNGMRDDSGFCLIDGWADVAVYEVGRYNKTQPVEDDGKTHAECLSPEFRAALREEVRLERERSHSLAQPCVNLNDCESLLQYHLNDVRR